MFIRHPALFSPPTQTHRDTLVCTLQCKYLRAEYKYLCRYFRTRTHSSYRVFRNPHSSGCRRLSLCRECSIGAKVSTIHILFWPSATHSFVLQAFMSLRFRGRTLFNPFDRTSKLSETQTALRDSDSIDVQSLKGTRSSKLTAHYLLSLRPTSWQRDLLSCRDSLTAQSVDALRFCNFERF